jgi:hypothetical protein
MGKYGERCSDRDLERGPDSIKWEHSPATSRETVFSSSGVSGRASIREQDFSGVGLND